MDLRSLIERKLVPTGTSGNDIIYICPKCNDKSGHLYINYQKDIYHCVRCDYGGHLKSLLKFLNVDITYDYEKIYTETDKALDSIIESQKPIKSEKLVDYSTDLDTLTRYYHLHTQPLSDKGYHYLAERGFSSGIVDRLQIREGVDNYGKSLEVNGFSLLGRDYSGRIMIPSIQRTGLISFYLGRDYVGGKPAKYLNPPKDLAVASEDVWSLDLIESSSVVICEGVMSAMSVNRALGKLIAVATYGKSIATRSSTRHCKVTSQGEKLLSKRFENYILFYDKDAIESSMKACQYLYDRGARVKLVKIPESMYGAKADANDMTNQEIVTLISSAEDYQGQISSLGLKF